MNFPESIIIRGAEISVKKLDWPIADESFFSDILNADLIISTPTTMIVEAMAAGAKIILDDTYSLRFMGSCRRTFRNYSWFDEIYNSPIPRIRSIRKSGKIIEWAIRTNDFYKFPVESIINHNRKDFSLRVTEALEIVEDN